MEPNGLNRGFLKEQLDIIDKNNLAILLQNNAWAKYIDKEIGWGDVMINSNDRKTTLMGHFRVKLERESKFFPNELALISTLIKAVDVMDINSIKRRRGGKRTKKSQKTNRGRRNRSRKH